ncbi:G protein-coupled receptor class C group 6 member A, transcript variant X3 [Ictidomys tridecemlineatus]|uniref:G-protein coupled receptor family C group 6 member A isoform X3 n=1 Tax=Ictidomys tridecemlineatus TaxID=43179 RepID=UPI00038BEE8A|nr:G-protein coupled receptor family C group 6 member A isoform X3 [Ictidomys tridecemlineatus]KAG3290118.1 G protein-coupled receptor class C group 6 member A, transcript variant X3 [Ictidomys tridecemlineatus]
MALLMILITCFMAILATSQPCQTPEDFVAVTSPGHIMIGGLFAIHEKMLSSEDESRRPQIQKCVGFEVSAFLQTLAMIHSIEMINNSTLLSGVKLGYEIYDTCTEVTAAMAATLRFLSKFNCSRETVEFQCDYSNYMPRVKAVIGAGYSEITMAVSRMLNLQLIPQVSYESTAEILSDKIRFPSFLRTVPSDFYQTKAMAHLIQKSGWNWIGIITTDDDYGRLALDTFAIQAAANNVCIAFKEVFPAFLSDNTIEVMINQTLEKIIAEAQLLDVLKNVTFTDGGNSFHFDAHGDLNIGYDVVLWKEINGHMTIAKMAEYDLQNDVFIIPNQEAKNEFRNLKQTLSKCSKECSPGEMKKTTRSQHICCYECVSCPENHYSNQTDMDHCVLCNNETHWAPVRSAMCLEKEVEYLNWNDSLALLLVALSLLGIIFVLAIGIIFTRNLNTPVVKSSGGLVVCYVILLCHFLNFASTGFFIGEPQDFTCKTRQTLFGVSFTLCISCILMKSLKILLAFSFDPNLQNFLKCLYKPIPIIFTCTGIQVIICILWLIFAAPTVEENVSLPRVIILECEEGSTLAFGTMLGYIAILAFICFIFAFKGRKLPENYNEAKFITFGMLIYFIAWITFIPVYATTFGKYLPAVEIIVILISNYGILCCTFFPKCYVILCKQETNTKSAFLELIYSYSSHSAGNLAMSHASLDSISSNITTTHPSPRGNSAAWQKSKDLQVQPFAQTCRDNGTKVSKTFPRKRISSI